MLNVIRLWQKQGSDFTIVTKENESEMRSFQFFIVCLVNPRKSQLKIYKMKLEM